MTIDADTRLKRARMRAWRRGMREMDLILGRFLDARAAALEIHEIDAFERLLDRRDADLYAWVAGRAGSEPVDATSAECILVSGIRAHLEEVSEN